ncbi:MAG: isocitrate/isopropylmalate family dehydrogenase [Nitrososphaerales archaeon]|jgi:3-isopropylmalate dehydrogenase
MAKNSYSIAVIEGDGIGPEVVGSSLRVLDCVARRLGFGLDYRVVPGGDAALRELGDALPRRSIEAFESTDACLKGPVGETVRIINDRLRFDYDLYANVRPARSYPGICPPALRPDLDLTIVRENSEGFYRAIENEINPGVFTTTGVFTEAGAKRLARFSFEYAIRKSRLRGDGEKRAPHVVLATKANIFPRTHGLYLSAFRELAAQHPEVRFEHFYADAMCARLVRDPERFDVIASENLLADLLSDLAGQVAGGLGMTPGTNINYETRRAYFEPTHGSAPDIAGKGIANPIGQVRSAAMLLDYLAMVHGDERLERASTSIEASIGALLNSRSESSLPMELGGKLGSSEFTDAIVARLEAR